MDPAPEKFMVAASGAKAPEILVACSAGLKPGPPKVIERELDRERWLERRLKLTVRPDTSTVTK
jgi:hypothetical protein